MAKYKHKFKVGQTVRIAEPTDETVPGKFCTVDGESKNYVGKVISIHTKLDAGIGESETDPVYMVRVPKVGTDLFWTEELKAVRA